MQQEFEEIYVRTKMNKFFGKETIPYKDFDLLEKIVVCENSQQAILLVQQMVKEFNGSPEGKEQRDLIITHLYELYVYMENVFKEGEFQCEYAHKVTMENLRLKKEIEELKLDKKIGAF